MTTTANPPSTGPQTSTARVPDAVLTLAHVDGHGSELRVFDAEDPRGLLLVLPGIAVGARYYDPLAAAFAEAGFTAGITELPGQGTSTIGVGRDAVPTGYHDAAAKDFPDAVDALRAHAAAAGLPAELPLFVLGHSQGGQLLAYYIARETALAEAGRPNAGRMPAGLIGVATQSPYYRGYAPAVGRRLRLGSVVLPLGARLAGSVPAAFFGGKGRQPGRRIDDWSRLVRTGRLEPRGADIEYRAGLAAATVPTLAVTLDDDELAPAAAARYWLDLLPAAPRTMRHIAEDLGHNRWARVPAPVVETVLDWIDALGLAPR